jgi:hypothetical protein
MGLAHSPKIVTDGLVFAYDMANTHKSWKGAPTTNLITTPLNLANDSIVGRTGPASCGSSFTDFDSDGPTNGPFVRITRVSTTISADWPFSINYPSIAIGTTFRFSCHARCINGSVSSIRFSNPDVEGVGFSLTPQWQRFSATFTSGAQSSLQFMRINRSNANDKTIGSFYDVANAQIEVQPYTTPFVVGTRSNTQAIVDLTGNNTVTATSLTYASDGTFSFNALSDNYCSISSPSILLSALRGTTNITVESWVYYTSASGGTEPYSVITCWGAPWVWLMENPSQTLRFRITAGGSDVSISDTSTHALNQWIHVLGTYDGSTKKIYVNGVLKNSNAQTGALGSPSGVPYIGTYQGPNYSMNGKISSIKIYNRALSSEEVRTNYNALRGRFNI